MDIDDILFGIWLTIVGIIIVLYVVLGILSVINHNTNINEYQKCTCYIVEENK